MPHKHLHELLKENQEPFHLKNYIADKRFQLKNTTPKTTLHLKKPKPIKQPCLFSLHNSPDVGKSPLFDFPAKSPNTVFLHIPSRTAALLLEAAIKIQKHSSFSKPKTHLKTLGVGVFGSILKKLRDKNGAKKREVGYTESKVGYGYFPRKREKVQENMVGVDEKSSNEMGFFNEEKSMDLETSSSCEKHFCSSPFRFSFQKSPSSGCRTPALSSPAASPSRHNKEEKENHEVESLAKIQPEEEEEKDQCSPVSVFDPPFEDDEDRHERGDAEEDGYDLECSYAIVQRVKQQLLHKLHRFERLAELDPIELEKIMLEEEDYEDDDEYLLREEECDEDDESLALYSEDNVDEFVKEVFTNSSLHPPRKMQADMKRLDSDLIAEGKRNNLDDREVVMRSVCKRLDSWKEVESNTIDITVELDFRKELDGWKRNDQEMMGETAKEIESGIFGLLLEELSEELVFLA